MSTRQQASLPSTARLDRAVPPTVWADDTDFDTDMDEIERYIRQLVGGTLPQDYSESH